MNVLCTFAFFILSYYKTYLSLFAPLPHFCTSSVRFFRTFVLSPVANLLNIDACTHTHTPLLTPHAQNKQTFVLCQVRERKNFSFHFTPYLLLQYYCWCLFYLRVFHFTSVLSFLFSINQTIIYVLSLLFACKRLGSK